MALQKPQTDYKKRATIFLVIWLSILPLALILQTIIGFVTAQVPDAQAIETIINILSFLMGIYFFIGWIPVVIFYSKSKKAIN